MSHFILQSCIWIPPPKKRKKKLLISYREREEEDPEVAAFTEQM